MDAEDLGALYGMALKQQEAATDALGVLGATERATGLSLLDRARMLDPFALSG